MRMRDISANCSGSSSFEWETGKEYSFPVNESSRLLSAKAFCFGDQPVDRFLGCFCSRHDFLDSRGFRNTEFI